MFSLLLFLVNGWHKKNFVTNDVQFPGNKMSKEMTWLIFLHLYIIDKYIAFGNVCVCRARYNICSPVKVSCAGTDTIRAGI